MLVPRDYVPANNDGSRAIVVVSWVFPALATFAVVARFTARKLRKAGFGLDDWFILAALIPTWGHTAVILASVYLAGVGHHQATLSPQNGVDLYKTLEGLQFSFGTSLGLVKISIVLLLIRIFFTRKFRICAYIVLGYQACWMLMTILIGACMCRPFAKNWNPELDGHCGDRIPAYIGIAALDIIGDCLIVALPMPMIWKLQSTTANKIGLSFVFALGILDIIVAILRIIYLVELDTTKDYTWDAVDCWIWSVLEPSLAAMVACGPTLGPIIGACLGRVRSTIKSSKGSGSSSGSHYLSYPKNPKQFSNISDSEYPLHNIYGNSAVAGPGSAKGQTVGTVGEGDLGQITDEGSLDRDPRRANLGVEENETFRSSAGIRVQRDVQIRRSPSQPVVSPV